MITWSEMDVPTGKRGVIGSHWRGSSRAMRISFRVFELHPKATPKGEGPFVLRIDRPSQPIRMAGFHSLEAAQLAADLWGADHVMDASK